MAERQAMCHPWKGESERSVRPQGYGSSSLTSGELRRSASPITTAGMQRNEDREAAIATG